MDLVFAPSEIETWPIDRLRPYARNAKTHGDDQVAKIAASMAKFGWTVPCMVADDGELIAGHGRVLAATMLGLTEVPVIRLGHLDEAERRAYRIADNRASIKADQIRTRVTGSVREPFCTRPPIPRSQSRSCSGRSRSWRQAGTGLIRRWRSP